MTTSWKLLIADCLDEADTTSAIGGEATPLLLTGQPTTVVLGPPY